MQLNYRCREKRKPQRKEYIITIKTLILMIQCEGVKKIQCSLGLAYAYHQIMNNIFSVGRKTFHSIFNLYLTE